MRYLLLALMPLAACASSGDPCGSSRCYVTSTPDGGFIAQTSRERMWRAVEPEVCGADAEALARREAQHRGWPAAEYEPTLLNSSTGEISRCSALVRVRPAGSPGVAPRRSSVSTT